MPRDRLAPLGLPLLLLLGCDRGSSSSTVEARFDASSAGATVDHPHAPLIAGQTCRFVEEGGGSATIVTLRHVSHFPREVAGVECCCVVVRELHDDRLVEERFEYFAQDAAGHVWLLGVDATQLEAGVVIGREGSWRLGDPGARPGLVLPNAPRPGDTFERAGGGERVRSLVQAVDARVEASELGTFERCLRIAETTRSAAGAGSRLRFLAPQMGEVIARSGLRLRRLVDVADDARPAIRADQFVAHVDHPFFPLVPGVTLRYAGTGDAGSEEVVVTVLDQRERILGVDCTTVLVLEFEEGELVEQAYDWYAQDRAGTVWYFGSDVTEFEDGEETDSGESWRAGEAGAMPGLELPALPRIGDSYRQEYAPGVAEDLAMIHGADVEVSTPIGRFGGCLEVLERNPLEPDSANEFKYYAPSLGLVREDDADGSESLSLVEVMD